MDESNWTVTILDDVISVGDPDGSIVRLALSDVSAIDIQTTDSGPFGPDVWWRLTAADGGLGVIFPQGADGETGAVDRLMSLPGFDFEAMIAAMGSTENAVYPVWRRA